jgi:hypothetical protein
MALLYFSQARDVRRLREWAGRAPERAAGVAATEHNLPPIALEQVDKKTRRPLGERLRRIHIPQARYIALVVGALVVLGGAGLAVVQLIGDGDGGSSQASKTSNQTRDRGGSKRTAGGGKVDINPSEVTVAVLNGTTVAGLAAQVGEEATADGFRLGTVTNAARTDQQRTQVLYRKGRKDAADLVADRLGIRSIVAVDALSSELAGSFDVVVLVGADRAS